MTKRRTGPDVSLLDATTRRIDMPESPLSTEALLREAHELGRRRWPRLDLPYPVFAAYLLERLPPLPAGASLAQVLDQLHLADLYLACACVHQVPEAVPALDQHCLARLREAFRPTPPASLDDVLQTVRVHLLLGTSTTGPKLPTYRGESKLSSWVRVIALRMHLHQNQKTPGPERPEEQVLKVLADLPTPGPDAELSLIKSRFQREFTQALSEAFAALTPEQRNLLRFYYLDKLTTTELGKLLGVAQPTASRRIAEARAAVYEETRRLLQERLSLSSQEFESLLNVVRSQLDMSLSLLLKEEPEKN